MLCLIIWGILFERCNFINEKEVSRFKLEYKKELIYHLFSVLYPGTCSSTLGSATNQVYQALAQLLKLCDDVLLHGDQSSALDTENVTHVIGLVEEAVKNLVALAHEKIANKQKPSSATNNNR